MPQPPSVAAEEPNSLIDHSIDKTDAGRESVANARGRMTEVVDRASRITDIMSARQERRWPWKA
ncbi:MAG: hypothetical protein NVSMB6_16440 [Burkholderiaceae bacterium]